MPDGVLVGAADIPMINRGTQRGGVDGRCITVQQARGVKLAKDGHDAASAVHVFHMHIGLGGGDLAQHGHPARQGVDVGHGEINAAFMGSGEDMENGIGGPAHRDIQRHRVFKRRFGGDAARQNGVIIAFIVALGDIDDATPSLKEQFLTVGMGGQNRAIAG